jgi:hypothetical protein
VLSRVPIIRMGLDLVVSHCFELLNYLLLIFTNNFKVGVRMLHFLLSEVASS